MRLKIGQRPPKKLHATDIGCALPVVVTLECNLRGKGTPLLRAEK